MISYMNMIFRNFPPYFFVLGLLFISSFLPSTTLATDGGGNADPIASHYKPNVLFNLVPILENPEFRPDLLAMGFSEDQLPVLVGNQNGYLPQQDVEMVRLAAADRARLEEAAACLYMSNRRKMYGKTLVDEVTGSSVFPAILIGSIPVVNLVTTGDYSMYDSFALLNAVFLFSRRADVILPLMRGIITGSGDPLYDFERVLGKIVRKYNTRVIQVSS